MVPFLSGWLRSFFGNWHAPLVMLLVASLRQVVFAVLAGRNQFI
jgi:cyanate permease